MNFRKVRRERGYYTIAGRSNVLAGMVIMIRWEDGTVTRHTVKRRPKPVHGLSGEETLLVEVDHHGTALDIELGEFDVAFAQDMGDEPAFVHATAVEAGSDLLRLDGQDLRVGEAVDFFYEHRKWVMRGTVVARNREEESMRHIVPLAYVLDGIPSRRHLKVGDRARRV